MRLPGRRPGADLAVLGSRLRMEQTASVRPRPRPTATVSSVAVASAAGGAATYLVVAGALRLAGVLAAAAGAAFVAADRLGAAEGPGRAGFAGAVAERVVDAALLGALTWEVLPGEPRAGAAALLALSASYLSSYVATKAEGLGFAVEPSPGARPLRALALSLGLVTGGVEAGLWAASAVSLTEAAAGWLDVAAGEEGA